MIYSWRINGLIKILHLNIKVDKVFDKILVVLAEDRITFLVDQKQRSGHTDLGTCS